MSRFKDTKQWKAYLRGDLKKKFNPIAYMKWRMSIPWSNEQIAASIDEQAVLLAQDHKEYLAAKYFAWADHLRKTGRLSQLTFQTALSHLVKTCSVCGRKAIYRFGQEGRCRGHKYDTPATADYKRRMTAKGKDLAQESTRIEKAEASKRSLKSVKKYSKGNTRP